MSNYKQVWLMDIYPWLSYRQVGNITFPLATEIPVFRHVVAYFDQATYQLTRQSPVNGSTTNLCYCTNNGLAVINVIGKKNTSYTEGENA